MKKSLYFGILSICFTALLPGFAIAIDVSGTNSHVDLNDGVYADGTNAAPPNLFRNPELIKNQGNETLTGTVAFSNIPYFSFGNTLYFQFVYDMQETANNQQHPDNQQININAITISAGGQTVWELKDPYDPLLLNRPTVAETKSPLSAGGDMALFVPVGLFNEMGLIGSDILSLTVNQSNADDGGDEWVVLGYGNFFGPDDPIHDPPINPVPEPAAFVLLGTGLVGVAGALRRKKKNQAS